MKEREGWIDIIFAIVMVAVAAGFWLIIALPNPKGEAVKAPGSL